MAEDKDEGEVLRASSVSSVEEEGHFSYGLDDQISTIEDQLKRAEATLFDLQSLRGKLEAERQTNLRRAHEEQEIKESLNVKKENERLRHELREYHTEIGSLKEIISSLKDDLVKTAEKLETKVSRTLSSLEKEDDKSGFSHTSSHVEHKTTSHHREHKVVSHHMPESERNFFNDHLDKKEEKNQPTGADVAQTKPAGSEAAPIKDETPKEVNAPTVAEAPQNNAVEIATPPPTKNEEVKDQPQTGPSAQKEAEEPSKEVASPASPVQPEEAKAQPSMADAMLQDESKPNEVKAALVTQLEQSVDDTEAEALANRELDEYEEIKRELEALENEAIFKPVPAAAEPVSAPAQIISSSLAVSGNTSAQVATTNPAMPVLKKKSFVSKLFHKDKKEKLEQAPAQAEAANPAQTPAENQTQQPVADNSTQTGAMSQQAQPAEQVQPAQAPAVEASVVAQPIPTEPVAPEVSQPQIVEPEPVVTPPVHKVEEESEKKAHTSLADLFKNKKRKIKGTIDDGRHDSEIVHRSGGGGKLAIAAVVILFLAIGTGVFFKIKNAENLRQMYISKAKENVNESSDNSNKNEVPEEFYNLDPEKKYKEAYADLPFADTAWAPYSDNEFGISIEYPKNTSYRLKPVGSNNIWFLRKNGYLLKIEKISGQHSLGEIRDSVIANVKYKSEDAVVRGNSTIHLILQDDLPVKGNIYLTSFENSVYKIWYKTYAPGENPDDEQRVKKMLDSLDFVPIR